MCSDHFTENAHVLQQKLDTRNSDSFTDATAIYTKRMQFQQAVRVCGVAVMHRITAVRTVMRASKRCTEAHCDVPESACGTQLKGVSLSYTSKWFCNGADVSSYAI